MWYMIRNLRCTVTIDSVLANSKKQNAFLFTVNAIFRQSRLPPSGVTRKYAKDPRTKKTWRDSLPIDMFLSAVSVLVVAQSSSEIPEGLMNNPVYSSCDYSLRSQPSTIMLKRITMADAVVMFCQTSNPVCLLLQTVLFISPDCPPYGCRHRNRLQ